MTIGIAPGSNLQQRTQTTTPMARLPDGGFVDRVAMAVVRHHAATPSDRLDLAELMRTGSKLAQLEILLRHMGSGEPLLMTSFSTIPTPGHLPGRNGAKLQNVACNMTLRSGRIRWGGGKLAVNGLEMPDTMLAGLAGRPVTSIVEHPYLPEDLVVAEARRLRDRDILVEFVNDVKDVTP